MGCCYSSFEKEEMVSRCKARKRYMKQLVKARHSFSISHIMYLRSLKNTGAALLQFATAQTTLHHHSPPPQTPPPQPPPSPPPPMSPTSEAETTSTTYTASTPRPPPSPPLRSSTWDAYAWDPFMPPPPTRSDGEEWEDMSTNVNASSEMAVVVAAKSKGLVEIVKELDEYFLRAADSGGKVSELLEVPVCSISSQGSSGN
ncbi:hypothetical protein HanOQP8_Chr00c544g0838851 [Helianthus annuus]|nr:hypothetical protein HanOQP8_Chr14g0531311 [Helianthus annuus]KAJ0803384.1 hypothetical protein HanOQP8_Chr00c544g0838851 [Helianthus annuus]